MSDPSEHVETFGWRACADRLDELIVEHPLVLARGGRHFVSTEEVDGEPRIEFHPPTCLPIPPDARTPEEYLEGLDEELGEHLVILMQAGAAALGWWSEEALIRHKVLKTYVVRGKGRAQTVYAKTKGKSRYGSRLRLQLAQKHLVDINERLEQWWDEEGPADRIFHSCPQRTWPELFATKPVPPFEQRDARLVKIPIHVHVPNLEELERVRRRLLRGRVVMRSVS